MGSISFRRKLASLGAVSLCILLAVPAVSPVHAQDADTLSIKGLVKHLGKEFFTLSADEFDSADSLLQLIKNPAEAADLIADFLERPETLNEILRNAVFPRIRFLKDLDLQFKTFNVDSLSGLGFSYDYTNNSISRTILDKDPTIAAVFAQVKATGEVAFRRVINPKDFLQTNASGHLFLSGGGIAVLDTTKKEAIIAQRRALLMEAAEATNPDMNDAARTLTAQMLGQLSTHWYFDFSFAAGFESNQNFSSTQLVFGLNLGAKITPWSSPNANVFDWPFAALRWLAGADDWKPRASSFPTFIVGLDRIDPSDNTARQAAGDTDIFNRVRAEVSFRTPITAGAFFNADLRYYKQIDPPQVIISASLDEQIYFTASLTAANGLFVSYSTGRLPFDQKDDQIYELGFQYKF